MERVLGPEMGDFVRALHEEHGVIFHLGDTVTAIDGKRATLKSGGVLEADVVVVGVGVRPRLALAESAACDRSRRHGDAYLETSVPASMPPATLRAGRDPHSGEAIRVEHWVVAERQGQTAARNMLGQREVFDAVPFFWSQHYDVPINYVGHAEKWDEIAVDGDIAAKDCLLRYKSGGRVLAVASIYRDLASLRGGTCDGAGALIRREEGFQPRGNGLVLHHAYRNHRLRKTLPRFPLGHPGAVQHRDRLLRPPCRRHKRLALIYVDEDGGAPRTSFDEIADDVAPLRQCAEGRWSWCAAIASRCFCRNRWNCRLRIWRRFAPAWCRSRCSRCSARTRWNFACRIPAPRPSSPTRPDGRS